MEETEIPKGTYSLKTRSGLQIYIFLELFQEQNDI